MIKAGQLDRRITILRATTVTDPGSGQQIETWGPLATVWASWRRASAREQLAAAEIAATVTDVFEIRWSELLANVNPTDRLVYQGREYNIEEATEIDRRVGILIRGNARAE